MRPDYKKPFSQFIKKAYKTLQLAIEDEVEVVCEDPEVLEPKVGDLAGIRVHKFKFNRQDYLMAYRLPTPEQRETDGVDIEWLLIDF